MSADRPSIESPFADAEIATRYRSVDVGGVEIFYREAGRVDAPALLMLHGYPSSSRMFEPLLPLLAPHFRLVAPDYPGFGLSQAPERSAWPYTFAHIARAMADFTQAIGLQRYSLYMQDYGGPVGFRLALARPERVQALVIQNAVLHEDGLTTAWAPRRAWWTDRAAHERTIREAMLSVQAGMARHIGGRPGANRFDPDLWMDEIAFLRRPGMDAIQLDLAHDYRSNLEAYPDWQAWLRERRPPVLVAWGVHDPIFSVDGAQAIRREQPAAAVHLLDAGHFATYDRPRDIAQLTHAFLADAVRRGGG